VLEASRRDGGAQFSTSILPTAMAVAGSIG
jgi:hypothetical protein